MKIKYPNDIKKDKDKMVYLTRLEELLRLDFNDKGQKYKNKKISKNDFESYKKNIWLKKRDKIVEETIKYKNKIKNDSNINADIEKDFEI